MKPILVIEQDPPLEGLGLLAERLELSGLPYRRIQTWRESLDEVRPAAFAGIVPLGGNMGARDEADHPFLAEERRLLADAVEQVCRCSASVSVLRFWPSAGGDGEGGGCARDRLARRRSNARG